MIDKIEIIGCKEHNLKNISLTLPKHSLIVFCGVSGSGKTSLAIDTIHAEGQRKYVESLSAYSRQFLGLMPKPDVEEIRGLSPSIAITQKNSTNNPRSTVATSTEIYDYLRVLFARVGDVYSPATGKIIKAYTVAEITDAILSLASGTKIMILAPIENANPKDVQGIVDMISSQGFRRARINGDIIDCDETSTYAKIKRIKSAEVVVDRLIVGSVEMSRIENSVELALKTGDGAIWICNVNEDNRIDKYSTNHVCQESGFFLDNIDPTLFSFNNPRGACDECKGLGEKTFFSKELLVPDDKLSILEGAIHPGFRFSRDSYIEIFQKICNLFGDSCTIPFKNLSDSTKDAIFNGIKHKSIKFSGIIQELIDIYNRSESDFLRGVLNAYKSHVICPSCGGARLKSSVLAVKIDKKSIYDVVKLPVQDAIVWLQHMEGTLSNKKRIIADMLLKEIHNRLTFLKNVGLEYLTLDRKSGTLSGGEMQRITLASQLGSGLTGVLFVLDEPSIGLHPRDTAKLIEVLMKLRDNGNTIIVIEHEELIIKSADFFVDIGPLAGRHGGEIVFAGNMDEFQQTKGSITADYLFGRKLVTRDCDVRKWTKSIKLIGVKTNNLKNIDVEFPIGVLCCVSGVSGSGKSSLVMDTLLPALKKKDEAGLSSLKKIEGIDSFQKIIEIDQAPIGRTTRSNPITYIDGFTAIRELFANLPESKARGYKIGRFSFNVKGGRCEACEGDGYITVPMHFLSDVSVECDHCKGKRYNRETLSVLYNGKTISDVLDMTVDDGVIFFKNVVSVRSKLELLQKVGLGYIKLGQPSTTLSGGEAQRIKLAKELSKKVQGDTVYILDEPTTGLHYSDVQKLLNVLHALVDAGNSVIVVEHNIDVMRLSDWIIDLGITCGVEGGKIAACGTPKSINNNKKSSLCGLLFS